MGSQEPVTGTWVRAGLPGWFPARGTRVTHGRLSGRPAPRASPASSSRQRGRWRRARCFCGGNRASRGRGADPKQAGAPSGRCRAARGPELVLVSTPPRRSCCLPWEVNVRGRGRGTRRPGLGGPPPGGRGARGAPAGGLRGRRRASDRGASTRPGLTVGAGVPRSPRARQPPELQARASGTGAQTCRCRARPWRRGGEEAASRSRGLGAAGRGEGPGSGPQACASRLHRRAKARGCLRGG